MSTVNLGRLIEFLESQPQEKVVKFGFGGASSFRGSYYDVAFEPEEDVSIGYMLSCAKDALGNTYSGYKGGDFTMDKFSECHISEWGDSSGDQITDIVLKFWNM